VPVGAALPDTLVVASLLLVLHTLIFWSFPLDRKTVVTLPALHRWETLLGVPTPPPRLGCSVDCTHPFVANVTVVNLRVQRSVA
jgi:hypothetical protein